MKQKKIKKARLDIVNKLIDYFMVDAQKKRFFTSEEIEKLEGLKVEVGYKIVGFDSNGNIDDVELLEISFSKDTKQEPEQNIYDEEL